MSVTYSGGEIYFINNFLVSRYYMTEMYGPCHTLGGKLGVYYERDLEQKTKPKWLYHLLAV